ncbi:MAG: molybdenum cofactor biosynthesis protein MoaE, partial [Actinobacteria bacterium]|nr:molybdenum cofactor biosynthesis protein MoaE [Actinomycetota bacterium]
MIVLRADLSESPIDVASHEALVDHSAAGAVVSFAGVVRNHDGGRGVTRLEYSAHPSAAEVLAEVAADVAAASEGVRAIA